MYSGGEFFRGLASQSRRTAKRLLLEMIVRVDAMRRITKCHRLNE
jgi:hypothetical protein